MKKHSAHRPGGGAGGEAAGGVVERLQRGRLHAVGPHALQARARLPPDRRAAPPSKQPVSSRELLTISRGCAAQQTARLADPLHI